MRTRIIAVMLAFAAMFGLTTTFSTAASAAGPVNLDFIGASYAFPTWWGGNTTVCARNNSTWLTGKVKFSGPVSALRSVAPRATTCVSGRYWGVPVLVTNAGFTRLITSSY